MQKVSESGELAFNSHSGTSSCWSDFYGSVFALVRRPPAALLAVDPTLVNGELLLGVRGGRRRRRMFPCLDVMRCMSEHISGQAFQPLSVKHLLESSVWFWNERKTFPKDVAMCVVIRQLVSNWLTSQTWMGTHDCILCIFWNCWLWWSIMTTRHRHFCPSTYLRWTQFGSTDWFSATLGWWSRRCRSKQLLSIAAALFCPSPIRQAASAGPPPAREWKPLACVIFGKCWVYRKRAYVGVQCQLRLPIGHEQRRSHCAADNSTRV